MRRVFLVLALVLVAPAAARAAFDADTVDYVTSGVPTASIAVDPVTGTPHLGYVSAGGVRHAWRSGGIWQFETVTANGSALDWILDPDREPAAVYLKSGGVLALATHDGVWTEDTIAVRSGWGVSVSLAFDPVTLEPVVAWATDSTGAPSPRSVQVRLARRSAGAWVETLVDSFTGSRTPPSLALDPSGAPRIAYARGSVTVPKGLVVVSAASTSGPFTIDPVDDRGAFSASLALDPASADPRVAYLAYVNYGKYDELRVLYAWGSGGVWSSMITSQGLNSLPAPISLVLAPDGSPAFVTTSVSSISPGEAPADGSETMGCGGVETGDVYFATRSSATGFDPFEIEVLPRLEWDHVSGPRALARVSGRELIAYRGPRFVGCSPFGIFYAERAPAVGVPPAGGVELAIGALSPQPARSGQAIAIELALLDDDEVALGLYDLAGRRVAQRPSVRLVAGRQRVEWPLPDLAPGVYRLTGEAGSRARASRTLIVLR